MAGIDEVSGSLREQVAEDAEKLLEQFATEEREQSLGEKTIIGRYPAGETAETQRKKVAFKLIARGQLTTREFDQRKSAIFIGADPEDSDIILKDSSLSNKQLAVMRVADDYILADCGVNDRTSFNGIFCRQVVCAAGGRCVININNNTMIFDAASTRAKGGDGIGLRFGLGVDEPLRTTDECKVGLVMGAREYKLGVDPVVVGSCAACDLQLPDSRLQPFHGMFHWLPEGVAITKLSSSPVQVNGVEIEKTKILSLTDRVQIGGASFTLTIKGNSTKEAESMFANHDWSHRDFRFSPLPRSVSKAFDLPGNCGAMTVGRSDLADITLDDTGVSREHLQLIPTGKTVMVIDNYSANGTYVNGEQVNKARIRPGDCVEIGRSIFCLHYH